MVSGGVQQLVGAVWQRQYRRELADDEVGPMLAVGLGAVIADPGAQTYQAAGLQAQLSAQVSSWAVSVPLERTTRAVPAGVSSEPSSWVKAVGWGEKAEPSVRESATAGRAFQPR